MRKKITFTVISILLAAISFSGCKKDNKTGDQSTSVKNTVWTGEINYAGKAVEPISIAFGDGTLTWYELSGEYNGTWKIENGLLTISIEGAVSFKANISSDNSLTNIKSSDMSGRMLNNATRNGSDDAVLDNTTWTAPNVVFAFKPGSKIDMTLGGGAGVTYADLSYVRKGKSIRFNALPTYKWFLVTNSSTSMNGANTFAPDPVVYPFVATKQ
ncbi:hypothetical protein Q4E93_05570 [Flavitalea sp. BT771]|uniref:hypothetical protein n=1 Tax=Flavitalea sp. BT771 TaxID=3063329 RepID=UPI0026E26C29|nr:hypothetical protein [Flavitalea sp. BT771]MDO6430042.1 hypothetical protein [Flavitalea sp. BT771]MDV6219819.1 hypothetical protein [Flavitalea sp. BT771]